MKTPENGLFSGQECRVLTLDDAELRVKRGDGGKPTIYGYAARFNKLSQDLGGFREKIDRKAFDSVVKSADVRALANHNPDLVMGRTKSGTLMIEATQYGLRYEVSPPDTPLMAHWVASIERGDVDGSSFSFNVDEDAWDYSTDPPTRTLLHVRDLFDVGPVVYPAYLDATVAVRSLELRAVQFTSHLQRQRLRAMAINFPFLKG